MSGTREILRPSDIAPLLGLTTGRVYQLISTGVIPAVRIGRSLRVPRGAWEAWLREQGRGALAAARRTRQLQGTSGRSQGKR
jgi:excisionase family DNA binding protein